MSAELEEAVRRLRHSIEMQEQNLCRFEPGIDPDRLTNMDGTPVLLSARAALVIGLAALERAG